MQPGNSSPAGVFEIIAAALTYALGSQVALLVAPSLAIMVGWVVGFVGAIYFRDQGRKPIPFAILTFGSALAISTPLSVWLAPLLGQAVTVLLFPIGIAVPLFGDYVLGLIADVLPAKIRAIFGVGERP